MNTKITIPDYFNANYGDTLYVIVAKSYLKIYNKDTIDAALERLYLGAKNNMKNVHELERFKRLVSRQLTHEVEVEYDNTIEIPEDISDKKIFFYCNGEYIEYNNLTL